MDIGKNIKLLFDSPYSLEFKLDAVSTLACKAVGAASASILIYSGKDDKLSWAGHYVDPKIGKVKVKGNDLLLTVMNNVCACEYIYEQRDRIANVQHDELFSKYRENVPIELQSGEDDFYHLLVSFSKWRSCFQKLKQTLRHDDFSIRIDSQTITGEWFRELLQRNMGSSIFIKEISDIDQAEKNSCMKHLEVELQLTFTARLYLALPLSVGGRHCGVLRFLFPENSNIVSYQNGCPTIKEFWIKKFERMAHSFSLYLAIDHYIAGHFAPMQTVLETVPESESFEHFLNSRCEALSEIIRCRGAFIRRVDTEKRINKIIACSQNLTTLRQMIIAKDNEFFDLISTEMSLRTALAVFFNCNDMPFYLSEYVYRDKMGGRVSKREISMPAELKPRETSLCGPDFELPYTAVCAIPHCPGHFIFFLNSAYRPFTKSDIELLYPSLKNLGLELKEHTHVLEMKRRMSKIRQMHKDVTSITGNIERKSHEYIHDFSKMISEVIERLNIFPYHVVWECMNQEVPDDLAVAASYTLRNATDETFQKNIPLVPINDFDLRKDKYFPVFQSKENFTRKFSAYFNSGEFTKVFTLPIESGYSYFNLPVFTENDSMPQWILTLIYKNNVSDWIKDKDFFEFMEHLSHQMGIAWDNFRANTLTMLLEKIDSRLGDEDATRKNSTLDQLRTISRVLVQEIGAEWCGFFLLNEQKNTLRLETSNRNLGIQHYYSVTDDSNVIIRCFKEDINLRLAGRKNMELIFTQDLLKPIERKIREKKKKRNLNASKKRFTPYILFEHALLVPVSFGANKMGIMILFRSKHMGNPNANDRFSYAMRPFSRFETYLLEKVRRHVFNVFISHHAVQKRMRDIRNIAKQVISPISETITSTSQVVIEKRGVGKDPKEFADFLLDQLQYVNVLTRIATQYAANFEILLDIDTRRIRPRNEKINDLRKFLISYAELYTPVIRPKCIHINITDQTRSDISIEVDPDLFKVVVMNLLDNAVKYSFDPEDRIRRNLQYKPNTKEDIENVLITAEKRDDFVLIRISSCGIPILEEERRRIFNREFRGFHAPDRWKKGTGIGLYLAKEIIRLHNGTITLVSGTPEYNTVLEIEIP